MSTQHRLTGHALAVGGALVLLAAARLILAAEPRDAAAPAPSSAPQAAAPAAPALPPGARVVASGPGYRIVVTSGGRPGAAATAGGGPRVTNAPPVRAPGSLVCDGTRVLKIDNRNLEFRGNGITASHGCEVHITNSRIAAAGIALLVRGASVHVENSQIIGGRASIEATGGGQVYAETSTFRGARRRIGRASIHDLGGNTWQ